MGDLAKGRHINEVIADEDETQILLQKILDQLRIMNLHFTEWDSSRIAERDLYEEQEQ